MPKITYEKIENNNIIGVVRTNKIGSETEFILCSVNEYKEMSELEVDVMLTEQCMDYLHLYIKEKD